MKIIRLLLLLVISGTLNVALSQDFDVSNLGSIDVDRLTERQIGSLKEQIEKRGLSEQQLILLAKARGMSDAQINRLRERLLNSGGIVTNSESDNFLREALILDDQFDGNIPNVPKEDEIFGFSFFSNPKLSFEPSLNTPTPRNYTLGAGDEIVIEVWGASEKIYNVVVSPEGTINIPLVGVVPVSTLSIDQATKILKSRLSRIYSGLGSNTYLQVTLGKIRSIKVNIVGQVKKPGTYAISAFGNVLNALYYAGGPDENGSLRKIDVYRGGSLIESVDIYNVIVRGDAGSLRLEDQDILIVRPYLSKIKISGEVKRPMIYEASEGESVSDILEYAGGFTDNAFKSFVTIRRVNDLNHSMITLNRDEFQNFKVKGGDEIMVSTVIEEFENKVEIIGAVNLPGSYELKKDMQLTDVINLAEGLKKEAFLKRALIIRNNEDLTLTSLSVNLETVLSGEADPIYLRNGDLINIKTKAELHELRFVEIQGEVNNPGKYSYVDSMNVEDIIFLANGFKESAIDTYVEVAKRNSARSDVSILGETVSVEINADLNKGATSSSYILNHYDLVIVRKSPNYTEHEIVEVEGEVNLPGKYSLRMKNERISDLLKRAGGLTDYSYVKGATIIRRTEYYSSKDDEIISTKFRRENLQDVVERDSSVADVTFQQQESIGIDLTKILSNPGSKYDLFLQDGDILSIPKQLQTVRLRGELLYPANVRYDRSMDFRDYVGQSGGFSSDAKKSKSYIIYANGSVKRMRNFLIFRNFPKVEPGSEIIVPQKPVRDSLTTGEVIGLTSSVATLSLVVLRIIDSF